MESSKQAALVEIKTPTAKLPGRKYRGGLYTPSAELTGALVQAREYRARLVENLRGIGRSEGHEILVTDPRCILLIGDREKQLQEPDRQRSFELFRSGLGDVEIVTFDELFRKAEVLANLFGLSRKSHAGQKSEEKSDTGVAESVSETGAE